MGNFNTGALGAPSPIHRTPDFSDASGIKKGKPLDTESMVQHAKEAAGEVHHNQKPLAASGASETNYVPDMLRRFNEWKSGIKEAGRLGPDQKMIPVRGNLAKASSPLAGHTFTSLNKATESTSATASKTVDKKERAIRQQIDDIGKLSTRFNDKVALKYKEIAGTLRACTDMANKLAQCQKDVRDEKLSPSQGAEQILEILQNKDARGIEKNLGLYETTTKSGMRETFAAERQIAREFFEGLSKPIQQLTKLLPKAAGQLESALTNLQVQVHKNR